MWCTEITCKHSHIQNEIKINIFLKPISTLGQQLGLEFSFPSCKMVGEKAEKPDTEKTAAAKKAGSDASAAGAAKKSDPERESPTAAQTLSWLEELTANPHLLCVLERPCTKGNTQQQNPRLKRSKRMSCYCQVGGDTRVDKLQKKYININKSLCIILWGRALEKKALQSAHEQAARQHHSWDLPHHLTRCHRARGWFSWSSWAAACYL